MRVSSLPRFPRGLGFALLGSVLALPLAAQSARQFVTFAPAAAVHLRAGEQTHVVLKFRVAEGYHVNSNTPHSKSLIPTELHLEAVPGVRVGRLKYSSGRDFRFSFDPKQPLNVYSGDFTVEAAVAVAPHAAGGDYLLRGQLRYQACDESACYPPKSLPIALGISVERGR